MSVTVITATISFSYTFAAIFDKVEQLTTRVAQSIGDKEGNAMIDMYAVSDDEKDTVLFLLQDAARNLFKGFGKLTFGITDAITISDTLVSLKIKNNGSQNTNTPNEIDGLIELALINYILAAWFAKKILGEQSNYYYMEYIKNVKDITDKTFRLRIPA